MGGLVLEIHCPKDVHGIAIDPQPDWSLDSLLLEINFIEKKLNEAPSPYEKTHSREYSAKTGFKRSPAFVMRVSDEEMEYKEGTGDREDTSGQALVVGRRFAVDDISDSEDPELDLVLNGQPYLMEKVGLVEGVLCEFTREHHFMVMEEVRNQISALEADLADTNEKFTSAIAHVGKKIEARRELEKKLDLQYQRTVYALVLVL